MRQDHVYVQYRHTVIKTDEDGYERIRTYYNDVDRISKWKYLIIKGSRIGLQYLLFPLWFVLFVFHVLYERFDSWYPLW